MSWWAMALRIFLKGFADERGERDAPRCCHLAELLKEFVWRCDGYPFHTDQHIPLGIELSVPFKQPDRACDEEV
jgi:hypothetical protein